MPTLFPPEYPDRPDAPLLSFGPSFSEEISRSVIQAVWHQSNEKPHEAEVRVAAALTMLEAFHPRDHLECMLAAQGVAAHAMIMECYRRAMHAETPEAVAIKLRSNIAQLSRTFSVLLHDLERRQSKPLLARPPALPPAAGPPPDNPSPSGPPQKDSSPDVLPSDELSALDAVPERPEDIETRPDGTPGSLAAYAPKQIEEVFIPREPAIMVALATRPKPWRMVNAANDDPGGHPPAADAAGADEPAAQPARAPMRGPLDLNEPIFTGDALSRFASARFDPDAPIEPLCFDDEDSYQGPLILTRDALPESPVHESLRSLLNSWSIGWLRY